MKAPTVLEGREFEIRERPPPPSDRIAPHRWMTDEGQGRYQKALQVGFELYLSKHAEEKIRNHSLTSVNDNREVMGMLLGWVYRHDGREYVMVRDVVTTDLEASAVRVRFDPTSFEKLFDYLDESGFQYIIVGWYHTHPGHGCFMSSTDIDTQKALFSMGYHTALVIDPINRMIEAFAVEGDEVRTRSFAVYWEEYQSPYLGRGKKIKRIRSDPDCMAPPEGGLVESEPVHEDGDEGVE